MATTNPFEPHMIDHVVELTYTVSDETTSIVGRLNAVTQRVNAEGTVQWVGAFFEGYPEVIYLPEDSTAEIVKR